jgi:hypothetical protein
MAPADVARAPNRNLPGLPGGGGLRQAAPNAPGRTRAIKPA